MCVIVQPVRDQLDRVGDRLVDADLADVELHDAGIDRRQVENVVDDGQQHRGGRADVVDIFALPLGQRTGVGNLQQLREADDVGERRAQFVGDVLDELVLQMIGLLQRLVLVLQRALDVDAVGDVDEGHHHLAVGQMDDGVAQHLVGQQLGLAVTVASLVVEAGDGGDEIDPGIFGQLAFAGGADRRNMRAGLGERSDRDPRAWKMPGSTGGHGRPDRTRRRLRPGCRASRPGPGPPSGSGFPGRSFPSGSRTPR